MQGSVGLACRLMHTTPESVREELPLEHPGGGSVLAADARIDNRRELIAQLDRPERDGPAPTDGELILAAHARWGEDCARRLLGAFAFAVWGPRNRRLVCGRDPMGVKPFYYCHRPGFFAFASEIKALLTFPEVPRRLDEGRLADHLMNAVEGMQDQEITFYRDIKRLPPGHTLVVAGGRLRKARYWSPEPGERLALASDEEYAEAFLEIFTEAVNCRLRCPSSVGSELSGGLDSSSIVCVARELRESRPGRDLHTFSAVFPNLPDGRQRLIDERPFMDAVLAGGDLVSHRVEADRRGPLADVEHTLWLTDEPFFGPNLFLNRALYGLARDHGVRVLLSGLDGDTTVSKGTDFLTDLARTGRWWRLMMEVRALRRRTGSSSGLAKLVWKAGFRPLVPETVVRLWRRASGRKPPLGWAEPALAPGFAERIDFDQRLQAARRASSQSWLGAREKHAHALASGHWTHGLELFDKTAAWFGIEPRYPFFDRRLIDFCLSLPPDQSLKHGWERFVLRNAMQGILPEEVRTRPHKANLESAFRHGLRHHDLAKLAELLEGELEDIAAYADTDRLRATYRRLCADEPVSTGELSALFEASVLALWMSHDAGPRRELALRSQT